MDTKLTMIKFMNKLQEISQTKQWYKLWYQDSAHIFVLDFYKHSGHLDRVTYSLPTDLKTTMEKAFQAEFSKGYYTRNQEVKNAMETIKGLHQPPSRVTGRDPFVL